MVEGGSRNGGWGNDGGEMEAGKFFGCFADAGAGGLAVDFPLIGNTGVPVIARCGSLDPCAEDLITAGHLRKVEG